MLTPPGWIGLIVRRVVEMEPRLEGDIAMPPPPSMVDRTAPVSTPCIEGVTPNPALVGFFVLFFGFK